MSSFLKTQKTQIVLNGKSLRLKGVNLGGWLMMEGYILHSLNRAEQLFKKEFAKTLGNAALAEFEKKFRDHFIREDDLRRIASWGCNCIRLPFNCRLIDRQGRYDMQGVQYLDQAIEWAQKYEVWVILDLHAACGSQNHNWHSDSLGPAELWERKDLQDRTIALWEFLADRYKDNPGVAGYDLLNEAVIKDAAVRKLNSFYQRLIKAIRRIDRNHILFVEGNTWATDLECLDKLNDDNAALSVHFYEPADFCFNLVPQFSTSKRIRSAQRDVMTHIMEHHHKLMQRHSRPIFVGEFGVNYREGIAGEGAWVEDLLTIFDQFGFSWTYWTYKSIKNSQHPDGLLSDYSNPPWVNRQGPDLGWENYARLWPKHKNEMIQSWQSKNFAENQIVIEAMRKFL